jgi:hypothetical protein
MIRIDKGPVPGELIAAETRHLARHIADYEESPEGYTSKPFKISEDYKLPAVVAILRVRQHNKCCFSESKFRDYAHVEHFRPKARVDEYPKGGQLYPGYYWLAYRWENLFLCTGIINVGHKKNFFPLVPGSERNRSHLDGHVEEALIIDPGAEDPRDHIRFHEDEPVGITERGTFNVQFLGLRHPLFEEARRALLKKLREIKETVEKLLAKGMSIDDPVIFSLLASLRSAMRPDAEFSSMAIDFLSGWPHLT